MVKRSSHGYEHVTAEEQRREWERTKQELALTKRKLMESEELVLQLKTATRKLEETLRKRDKDFQRVFAVLRAPPDDQLTQTRKQELIERLVMDTQQRATHAEALAEERKKELDRLHFSSKFLRQRELEVELEECHIEIARLRAALESDRLGDRSMFVSSNQLHDASAWSQRHSPKQQTRSSSAESARHTAPTPAPSMRATISKQFTDHETVAPGVQILKPTTQKPKKESFVTKTRRRALEAEYFKQVRLAQLEAECELNENLHIRAAREAKAHREVELLIQRQKQQAEREERIAREREERLALEQKQTAVSVVAIETPALSSKQLPPEEEATREDEDAKTNTNQPYSEPQEIPAEEGNVEGEADADTVTEGSKTEERCISEELPVVPAQEVTANSDAIVPVEKPRESAPEQLVGELQEVEKAAAEYEDASDNDQYEIDDDVHAAKPGMSKQPKAMDSDEVDESMDAEHHEKAEDASKTAAPHYEEDFRDEDDEPSDVEHHENVVKKAPHYEEDEFEDNDPSALQHEEEFAPETAENHDAQQSETNPEPSDADPIANDVENKEDASLEQSDEEHRPGFVIDSEVSVPTQVSNSELLQTSDSEEVENREELDAPQGFVVDVQPPIKAAPTPDLNSREVDANPGHDTGEHVQGFLVPVEYSAAVEEPVEQPYYEQMQPAEQHRHGVQSDADPIEEDASVEEHRQGFVVDIEVSVPAQVTNASLLQIDSPTEDVERREELDEPHGFVAQPPIETAPTPDLSNATTAEHVQGFLLPVEYSAAAIAIGPIAAAVEQEPVERPYYEQTQTTEAEQHHAHGGQGLLDHVGDALDHALDVCEQLVETAGEHVTAAGHSIAHGLQQTREAAANAIQRLWRRQRKPTEPTQAESAHDEALSVEPSEAERPHEEPSLDTARTTTTDEYSGFSDEEPDTP